MSAPWLRVALTACMALAMQFVHAMDKIHTFGPDSYARIVAAHKGQPFVVLVWSLDCDYCLPSFKALAEIQQHAKLPVVAITTDPADNADSMAGVSRKISGTGLIAEKWAFGSARVEQLRYAIDPKWHGEMPRSYWYDGRGNVTPYSGVITKEIIARQLERMQAPHPPAAITSATRPTSPASGLPAR